MLRENNGRKNTLVAQVECFQMLEFKTSAEVSNSIQIKFEGAVSHIVAYYQQLSNAPYQVSFYANNYFEYLPIVSSAF